MIAFANIRVKPLSRDHDTTTLVIWSSLLSMVAYIIDEYGRDRLATWLPNMFSRAWAAGVIAIPIAQLSNETWYFQQQRGTLQLQR